MLLLLIGAGLRPTADRILHIARFESRNLGHNFAGTEHVLCALARLPDSRLRQLFAKRGVTIENIRSAVIGEDTLGRHRHSRAFRPLTPRLRQVLMIADGLAHQAKHLSIPQRLFVAIITEGWGVAVRVLRNLHFDLSQLRQAFPETAIEPKVTLGAFKPGEIIWFIHPTYGVTQAAGFIRDHKTGAYVFGGHTGSHYTGHGESATQKLATIQGLGYLWWPYARWHNLVPLGWLPPEEEAKRDVVVKRIQDGEL
jgi:hypothetical protein